MTGEHFSASLATAGRRLSGWLGDGVHRVPVKKIQNLLIALLVVWVVYSLVRLVLILLPSATPSAPAVEREGGRVITPQPQSTVDLVALQAMNWFGTADVVAAGPVDPVPQEETIDAAKTQLNLVLEGIVYSAHAEASVAVIVHQGKQEQYRVGESIPGQNGVKLARVQLDHVILDNNGRYESLWLYDDSKPPVSGGAVPRPEPGSDGQVSDLRGSGEVTEMASEYQQRLYKNPASLAEVIRITPEQRDGQMVGYRISPGKDRAQFEQLGLQANDIVTSINGIELNEPSNALEIYKLMRTAKEATFTLDRGGEPVEIMVSLQ